MSAVQLRVVSCERRRVEDHCSRCDDLPYRDVEFLDKFVARRTLADVDAVQLLLFNVDEAYCVGLLFPEGPFTERAIELNVRLKTCKKFCTVSPQSRSPVVCG